MVRSVSEVVFVDGVRTPFGKAGSALAETRADDLVVKVFREVLRRNPNLPAERLDDVSVAATTQVGDQGMTIGRTASLLAGIPHTVPGYSIDRMCAGAMTAVTTLSSSIMAGAYDLALAGGVESMSRHPMGDGMDPNPRFLSERLVDTDALIMGATAENLHDRFPQLTKERADAFAYASQQKTAHAYEQGWIQQDLVPIATRSQELGWGLLSTDESMRPETTLEGLATLKTPFRPHGRVTAGNASGLNDGATAALLASESAADELGLSKKMRMVGFAFAGVEPEVMGIGPVPSTQKALDRAGLSIDDIDLFEVNEAFAVVSEKFMRDLGLDRDKVNVNGGAMALGHPIGATGAILIGTVLDELERQDKQVGLVTMCAAGGMAPAIIIERV